MNRLLDDGVMSQVASATNIERETIESYKPIIQTILGRAHAALGDCYRASGMFSEATEELKQSIEMLTKIDDTRGLAVAYSNLASSLLEWGRGGDAVEYAHKVLGFAHKLHDNYILEHSYINLGVVYAWANRQEDAARCYEEASKFPLGAISSLQLKTNIAVAHIRNGEHNKAIDEARDAYSTAMKVQEFTLGAYAAIAAGDAFFKLEQFESVLEWYQKATEREDSVSQEVKRIISDRLSYFKKPK